jgi:2-succinyl-5-enolpyruvyl-6-hydroxy-3-cyclohexene-1-carboxylate synthase
MRNMYSTKTNVQQLISYFKEYYIGNIVVCPGSRNAPIVQSFAADDTFFCHSVVDERSAGFYAIGLYHATGEIVAVCCTSGSALLNLAPAVAEAYYQKIPMIIISADRPQGWIGQMDGQTLPQQGVFNGLVKKDIQLVEADDDESRWYNNRLINEAIFAATCHCMGPVHINVPISEPMFDFSVKNLPKERVISHNINLPLMTDEKELWMNYNKILVICGQESPVTPAFNLDLLSAKGCVIFTELLANYGMENHFITNFDAVLSTFNNQECPEGLIPDLVITIGGHIVSKRLKSFLRLHHVDHWLINDDGNITDTFMSVTKVIEGEQTTCIRNLSTLPKKKNDFYHAWKEISDTVKKKSEEYFKTITTDLSSMNMVQQAMKRINNMVSLHLGNSMAVRLAQLCEPAMFAPTLCNRGVNGIEGTLSSAVGYSKETGEIGLVIIGDLSFFYDMNVLRHARDMANLRILLLNNGGGGIFHTLNGLNETSDLDEYVAAGHNTNAEGWAKELGFDYLKVINVSQIETAMDMLFNDDTEHPVLIETITNSTFDKHIFNNYYKYIRQ